MATRERKTNPRSAEVLRYWQAVAEIPTDRRTASAQLESVFRSGEVPTGLSGPMKGRLLTTTVGHGIDAVFMGLAHLWMPWQGKTIDPAASEGRNLFTPGFRPMLRTLWPRYHDVREESLDRFSTFRFITHEGPSVLFPEVTVFKIDYDHPGSPTFLISSVLDELVSVGDGVYLGQALMSWQGAFRRAAWFSLTI